MISLEQADKIFVPHCKDWPFLPSLKIKQMRSVQQNLNTSLLLFIIFLPQQREHHQISMLSMVCGCRGCLLWIYMLKHFFAYFTLSLFGANKLGIIQVLDLIY